MTQVVVGFMERMSRKPQAYPPRGERIARWVQDYMARQRVAVAELAFRINVDRRDLTRLIRERSIGPRLNDALEEAFGCEFIDAVAAPVVGGDRITVLEREIASEKARIAALDARLEREKTARRALDASLGGQLRLVAEEGRSVGA